LKAMSGRAEAGSAVRICARAPSQPGSIPGTRSNPRRAERGRLSLTRPGLGRGSSQATARCEPSTPACPPR
jgi:hypothetical protein